MYAKLVVGSLNISAMNAMRDIGRLITSSAPSTANLTMFSTSSSIIVDATPAGWTYVGSTNANDQPNICATNTNWQNNVQSNLCFSAPTSANASVLKYCALTIQKIAYAANSSTGNTTFTLTGAQSANSTGILTNEGFRLYGNDNSNIGGYSYGLSTTANKIFHVIANQRHLTIIQEGNGFQGVWETSQTDLHTFQNIAPFIQVGQTKGAAAANTGGYTQGNIIPLSNNGSYGNTCTWIVFNITDPNTGTNYGTYDVSESTYFNNGWSCMNDGHLVTTISESTHQNSLSSVGAPTYIIEPIYFNVSRRGYPTQFVTGICPIYYCSANMGNSGDTVNVLGDTYTFFNAGITGLLLKTS
jgi:hypothetical protein